MTERRHQLLAATLLLAALVAVWVPLTQREPHSEDLRLLERISATDATSALAPPVLRAPYPLATLLLKAEQALGRSGQLAPILATSLALHAVAMLLLLSLLLRKRVATGPATLFVAAWALHPIQVENLARPAGQGELLAVAFVLAGVHLGQRLRPGPVLEFALLGCLVLGAAASPAALLLPVAVIALEPRDRAAAVARLPLLVASALLAALMISRTPDEVAPVRDGLARVHDFLAAITLSIRDLAGPWALSPLHVIPAPLPGWVPPVVIGFVGACLWAGARSTHAARALAFFAAALLFAAARGARSFEYRADGWLALALLGFIWTVAARFGRPGRGPRALGVAVVVVWALLAHAQARIWSGERTLLDHAVAVQPDNWAARIARAELEMQDGDISAMERDAVAALLARPTAEAAIYLLGYARGVAGDDHALHRLGRFGLDGERGDPELRLGYLFLDIGLTDAAVQLLERSGDARESRPGLALAFARKGNREAARTQLGIALANEPASGEARLALAWLMATAPEPGLADPAGALRVAGLVEDPELAWRRLDAEAAALARMERPADAYRLAQLAVRGAEEDGSLSRADAIRARALLYLGGESWTEPRGSDPSTDGGVHGQRDEHDHRRRDPGDC